MSQEWEINESINFGKGLFATRAIEKCKFSEEEKTKIKIIFMVLGSRLVQLESEINVLEDFAIKNHCSKCLKRSDNPTDLISCFKCSIMKYCSDSCLVRILTLF